MDPLVSVKIKGPISVNGPFDLGSPVTFADPRVCVKKFLSYHCWRCDKQHRDFEIIEKLSYNEMVDILTMDTEQVAKDQKRHCGTG